MVWAATHSPNIHQIYRRRKKNENKEKIIQGYFLIFWVRNRRSSPKTLTWKKMDKNNSRKIHFVMKRRSVERCLGGGSGAAEDCCYRWWKWVTVDGLLAVSRRSFNQSTPIGKVRALPNVVWKGLLLSLILRLHLTTHPHHITTAFLLHITTSASLHPLF